MSSSPSKAVRAFAWAVAALALAAGAAQLYLWIAPGTVPGARHGLDRWPLTLVALAAAIVGAGLWKRADPRALALGALAWAFGVLAIVELPAVASTFHVGDGPSLRPLYLLSALGAGLYAVVGLRGHGLEERIAALAVLFASANGKLFSRGEIAVFPLLLAAVLLGWVGAERRFDLRSLWAGPARALVAIAGLLLAWTFAAALAGDSPTHGLTFWSHLLTGALLAWTLAGALGPRGAARVFGALVVGLGLSFVLLAAGVLEAVQVLGWSWIPHTRLRLFDLHPGLVAPYLAVGVCLGAALAAAGARGSIEPRRRPALLLLGLGLALACAAALWMNQARASLLGAVVGLGVLGVTLLGRLPRRPLPWGAAALALAALGAGLLLSPLGAGVRAQLEARTHTASALGQRYHYWQMATEALARDPLLGQGLRSEWARTDLARPSYLDGGDQALHAHNLLLSIGEAAGLPALLLFVLLALGVLEVGRRAILAPAASRFHRALACGLTAALCAHLTANMLSMGQARLTILPLYLWIALGLLAALQRDDAEREAPKTAAPARVAVASLLLLVFVLSPLLGQLSFEVGKASLARGEHRSALTRFDAALLLHPLDRSPHMEAAKAHFALGQGERAIARIERACDSSPRRSNWRFTLGAAQLSQGRAAEAVGSFERAFELDPRGRRAGDYLAARGWAHLRLGEVQDARTHLTEALRRGSTYWKSIPVTRLEPQPGDAPDTARIGFLVGDPAGPSGMLPLTELLAQLGREAEQALAQEPPDVVRARRLLTRAIVGYRTMRIWDEPLAMMESYAARIPERYSGTDAGYVRLLCDAGRHEEAYEVAQRTPGIRAHVPAQEMLRYYRTRSREPGRPADPAVLERAQELARGMDTLHLDDVWFHRGRFYEIWGFLAELAVRRGELEQGFVDHERELFDLPDAGARAGASAHFLRVLVEAGAPDDLLARQAARYVREASRAPGLVHNGDALDPVAALLAPAWAGRGEQTAELVERWLDDVGPTGELFLQRLQAHLR